MAQVNKAEAQVEIHCNADKLFDAWACKTLEIGKICSRIPKVELAQGDNCNAPGAILSWIYIHPLSGKHEHLNTLIEEIEEKKRSITYKLTDGPMMDKYYNTFREKVEFIPKGENCCLVKWDVFEYEKKCEDAPDPVLYVENCFNALKEMAHHL